MVIKEVFLHNVQAYQNLRIKLSPRINVIVGKNNTGKSTIIRSLLNFQINGMPRPETLIRKFEKDATILITVDDPPSIPTLRDKPAAENHAYVFESKNFNHFYAQMGNVVPDNVKLPALVDRLKKDSSVVESKLFYDLEPRNVFNVFLGKRKSIFTNGSFDEESGKRIDLDFRNMSPKLNRARSNTRSKNFDAACEDILGFIPIVLPGQQNMNLASVGYYVGLDENIPLDQMGDGVIQTVGLLVNLFFARGKIFLIEELENDLHPEALKKLLYLILESSKTNQFIISTHSNVVMRVLGSESDTKIFETKSDLVESMDRDRKVFISTLSEVDNSPDERLRILQDLGYELLDSDIWEGYLICEEASAETLIREFIIPAYVPKLHLKLRTIGARGASDVPRRFTNLHHLFTYVHTSKIYKNKAWILVDGDAAGKKAVEEMKAGYKSWPSDHFAILKKKNIEAYYPTEYSREIEKIIGEKDRRKKGTLKVDLAKKIIAQYKSDPDKISRLFKSHVKEIIQFLKHIEKKF